MTPLRQELADYLGLRRASGYRLRHTCAMRLLLAGVDASVIALWLGHVRVEATQIYLHADLSLKEQALAGTRPPTSPPVDTGHLAWLQAR